MTVLNPFIDKDDPCVMTPCKCPRCHREFEQKLFWVGKLPARKYCRRCNDYRQENRSSYSLQGQSPSGTKDVKELPLMSLDFMENINKTDRVLKVDQSEV